MKSRTIPSYGYVLTICEPYTLASNEALHGHGHDSLHLIRVIRGGFAERVDNKWIECGAETFRVSPPGTIHELKTNGEGCELVIIEISPQVTSRLANSISHSIFLSSSELPDLDQKFNDATSRLDEFAIESLSLEIGARALIPGRESAPEWLVSLRDELIALEFHDYSLAKVSARLGRHRSHVARAFLKFFGQSAGELVRAARLAEAKVRLQNFCEPIVQIAYDLGFSDQAHFSNHFRKRYGLSPSHFRQKMNLVPHDATLIQASNSKALDTMDQMHSPTEGIHVRQ